MIFLVKKTPRFHFVTVFREVCLCWGWMRRDGFSSEIQPLIRAGCRTHSHQYPRRKQIFWSFLLKGVLELGRGGEGCFLVTELS